MTFNEYVEDNPNIDGHLKVGTEFNKTKIKGTTEQKIPFPIKEQDVIIELDFKPNVKKSMNKKVYLIDRLIRIKSIGQSK